MRCSIFAILLVSVIVLCACSKSEAAPSSQQAVSVSSGPLQENPNYTVTVEPVGPYHQGEQGKVKVVLVAKGDYHINKQYPYKIVCAEPPASGVTYPKKVVPKADGTYEEKKAELPLPFVPTQTGKVKVAGTLSLSVCTEANCLMDKRPVELLVTVE